MELGLNLIYKEKNYGEYIFDKTLKFSTFKLNVETPQIIEYIMGVIQKEDLKYVHKAPGIK
ncbi:MAG: hypothetical protein R2771_01330 [Saprospiraceae bacterium]